MSITRLFPVVVGVALLTGCSSAPKYVSAAKFQDLFETRHTGTLNWYSYSGETNGAAYMLKKTIPLSGKEWKRELLNTEAKGLAPGFLEDMKITSKREQDGVASLLLRSETN